MAVALKPSRRGLAVGHKFQVNIETSRDPGFVDHRAARKSPKEHGKSFETCLLHFPRCIRSISSGHLAAGPLIQLKRRRGPKRNASSLLERLKFSAAFRNG